MRSVLIVSALLVGLSGCVKSNSSNTTSASLAQVSEQALSAAEVTNARANYTNYCGGCHGRELETFVNRKWQHGDSPEALFKGIKHGYPEQGMPAYATTFSDPEITQLVSFIRQGIVAQKEKPSTKSNATVHRSEKLNFELEKVVTGLDVPWAMAFLPNGDMLITEREGTLYRFTQNKELQKITGVPEVLAQGQGGLMDVKLHPDFSKNNVLFLSYSAFKKEGGQTLSTTAIMRSRLEGNTLTDQKQIFEAQPYARTRHHYGSRIEFGRDGYLYFSMGDRGGTRENPQNLTVHAGKTHRIKEDGTIPADNPFVNRAGAMPSIFTFGNRNPQGMALNPETGQLWLHEHGPKGGDEVNIMQKGANYGWADVTYGIDYNGSKISDLKQKAGITDPIKIWVPSIAPSGMAFVTGDKFKNWKGDLLVGSLSFKFLSRLEVDGNKIVKEERLLQDIGRVRDVRVSPDGYVYVAVENPGVIYRLVPVN
ncbi:PQQ-dependent sugar dehydrogenase [Rufibacter sediminis]|uniref:PQQ-dependent sugar dehydrogenase n=1 Tax=Rufibacter sediminis TaxID=2762756 RepID=A0ABR6VX28_9BACT|nr:PQQ-dependent sugar dehydrogenase [Rufibacter sediminis]MBC3541500.1 PQQ-dependent sugar dehydrogenase [Rufibacter sediminis]